MAQEICKTEEPPLARYPNGHLAACHHPLNVTADEIAGAEKDPSSPLSSGDSLPAETEANGAKSA
jgi:peptide/nickel transport system ATP-binding protein/oligopeptide transport system ATP-binding protein